MSVQGGDIDVGACRLGEAPIPAFLQAGNTILQLAPVELLEPHGPDESRLHPSDRLPALGLCNVDCPARPEETTGFEERTRCGGERLNARAAIAFRPERGRTSGRVIAGLV